MEPTSPSSNSKTTVVYRRFTQSLPFAITAVLLLAALASWGSQFFGGWSPVLTRMLDTSSGFAAVFLGIFIEAAPFLLLGTLASGLVEVFISREDLARWIPRRALGGAMAGSLVGLFFPVCECGVVPFTRRMLHKGLPLPAAVALLLAAPVVNPIVIISTLAAFGPGLVFWGRLVFTLLVAVVVGTLFGLAEPQGVLMPGVLAEPSKKNSPILDPLKLPLTERLRRMLVIAADEFFEMGRYLVVGSLLAASLQTFIPQSSLLGVGKGPLLSVLVMILLAVLLSVCSTVDAFIALAFAGTFSTGAVLAFLVYGPMVDIKSILMYLSVFKRRTVVYLVLLPMLMVILIGFVVNLL